MFVYIASDHAGFEMKEVLKKFLLSESFSVKDYGAEVLLIDDDYTEYIHACIKDLSDEVVSNVLSLDKAIIFGGSGTGEAIVANRYKSIRTVVYNGQDLEIVKLGREHNEANVLSIGARFVTNESMLKAVNLFLNTKFTEEERHVRRIKKIDEVIVDKEIY
jgi:ribose 5-phosphate isomerase B